MSTAGRPTFTPAKGGSSYSQGGRRFIAPSAQFSAKDQASHTKLKLRQPGQQTKEEIAKRDLKAELEERERKASSGKDKAQQENKEEPAEQEQLLLEAEKNEKEEAKAENQKQEKDIDADDSDSDEEDSSDSDSDDDEDDTAELLKELEKIKKEREEEARRQAQLNQAMENQQREQQMLTGNPLLAQQNFNIKKRWYEDTVFRNQARTEPKVQKRFINDTIRNDFHRKFLQKYIQ